MCFEDVNELNELEIRSSVGNKASGSENFIIS
jgi:hypothetical protein